MSDKRGLGPHMFGHTPRKLLEPDELDKLKVAMLDPPPPPEADFVEKFNQDRALEIAREQWIPPAYTYLFQFIAHDIVPETSRSETRQVTPQLNLDSVYGQGDLGYDDSLFDENGRFIHENAPDFDVWRKPDPLNEEDFLAGIPEPRNNENVIVVQLHRLFQKLHNQLVGNLFNLTRGQRIRQSQRFTQAIFHSLVIEDALAVMLNSSVYDFYFQQHKCFYFRAQDELVKLPVEFTHGAFRFGHSMVLSEYKLNENGKIALSDLLRKHIKRPLPTDMGLDWKLFFNPIIQVANPIDLKVTAHLGKVGHGVNLVERNLLAGENASLQSAEFIINEILLEGSQFNEFANAFHTKLKNWALNLSTSRSDISDVIQVLNQTTQQNRTPLWLAVLHENVTTTGREALKLGLLGSAIVGDTLRQSIVSMYPGRDYQTKLHQVSENARQAWACLGTQSLTFFGVVKHLINQNGE